jgi:predicted flap endonuclease-1-like 5' DNA nuclease
MKTLVITLASNGFPCWIWWLLAMLASFILGWLLSKLFGKGGSNGDIDWNSPSNPFVGKFSELKSDYDTKIKGFASTNLESNDYKVKYDASIGTIDSLKAEIATLKARGPEVIEKIVEVEKIVIKSNDTPIESLISTFNAEDAALVLGKKVILDDLKVVEGIGPKIEELFHAAGYKTWKSVAEESKEKLVELLSAEPRFAIHDPSTWSKQCQMMVDGKWDELKAYQDALDGGKE